MGKDLSKIRSRFPLSSSQVSKALSFSVSGIESGSVVARPAFAALSAWRINLTSFIARLRFDLEDGFTMLCIDSLSASMHTNNALIKSVYLLHHSPQ